MSYFRKNLILSSFFFSAGWFSLAFSIPLLGVRYGFNSSEIGSLGVLLASPFIMFSYLLRHSTSDRMLGALRYPPIVMALTSLLLIPLSTLLFLLAIAITNVMQGLYWITIEIYLGSADLDRGAEKYSVSWGIPNFMMPLIMGFVILYLGFTAVFIFAAIACFLSFLISPTVHFGRIIERPNRLDLRYISPIFFVGLSSGFIYYVLVPYLKEIGIPYGDIGMVAAIPGLILALGFILLVRFSPKSGKRVVVFTSILLSAPILLVAANDIIAIALVSVLVGIGSSIGFSKILSYITLSSDQSYGVFYFESLFGGGFIAGSLVGGILYGLIGFLSCLAIFLFPLAYGIISQFSLADRQVFS